MHLTDLKKTQQSYRSLIRFAFSTCKKYFVQEGNSSFSIVRLGEFEQFFSPHFNLEEDQKENYYELKESKRKKEKKEEPPKEENAEGEGENTAEEPKKEESAEEEKKEEAPPEEEFETINYQFRFCLVSSDNHLFFAANCYDEPMVFFGSKEKIPKLYEQLRAIPKDEEAQCRKVDFLDETIWDKYLVKKTLNLDSEYDNFSVTRQTGSDFFHIYEN